LVREKTATVPAASSSSGAGLTKIEEVAPDPPPKRKRGGGIRKRKKQEIEMSLAPRTSSNILPYHDVNNDPYFIKL
jgi:hypothetical protein